MLAQPSIALYSYSRQQGRWGRVRSVLTRRSRKLLTLDETASVDTVRVDKEAAVRTVPISEICGSVCRGGDFDLDFNPLNDHTKKRWLSVATARLQGKALSPVSLIQVGEKYFVQDGHHRISVDRARGLTEVRARVTVAKGATG